MPIPIPEPKTYDFAGTEFLTIEIRGWSTRGFLKGDPVSEDDLLKAAVALRDSIEAAEQRGEFDENWIPDHPDSAKVAHSDDVPERYRILRVVDHVFDPTKGQWVMAVFEEDGFFILYSLDDMTFLDQGFPNFGEALAHAEYLSSRKMGM